MLGDALLIGDLTGVCCPPLGAFPGGLLVFLAVGLFDCSATALFCCITVGFAAGAARALFGCLWTGLSDCVSAGLFSCAAALTELPCTAVELFA